MKVINRLIVAILKCLPKKFVWIFSKKYIAGDQLDDAVSVTNVFNKQGIKVTVDLLGEDVTRSEKIDFYKKEYIRLIGSPVHNGFDNSFSVKPTMFGLLIDEEMCYNHVRDLVVRAASYDRFVRIDMEDVHCTDKEVRLYKRLLKEFPDHVGIVFQSYLKRTLHDLEELVTFKEGRGKINIRICKGIYDEPAELAYKKREEINENFLAALEFMFQHRFYAAIATHDKVLLDGIYRLIEKYQIGKTDCEFQMLYGVTPGLRETIINKGYTMRIYVPYGMDWFNYSLRRLKENPKMVTHIIKALFLKQ